MIMNVVFIQITSWYMYMYVHVLQYNIYNMLYTQYIDGMLHHV